MTPLAITAIAIATPVAYVAVAGLVWSQLRPAEPCTGYVMLDGTVLCRYSTKCPACEQDEMAKVAASVWPVYGAWLVLRTLIVRPLRATFRLTARTERRP